MWSKEEIEGKKKQIEGAINIKAAEFIHDPQLAALGEVQLLAGEAQQEIGQVRRAAGEAAAQSDKVIAGLQQSI